jgi:glyoxylase-like metal-dependent hydrolase (beta-lactamase superfamily II)
MRADKTMSDESFRFNIGEFECIAISDGTMTYAPPNFPPPATFLFSNAPKEALEQKLREYKLYPEQWQEWTSPYICLLVLTGAHMVLVDTGAGGLAPTTGRLLRNLKSEGISPEDIDTIILTHGHPDHLGGNTDINGKPIYPKARWVMWKDEWEFWTSERAERNLAEHGRDLLIGIARKNLSAIRETVDLIDNEKEIVPGITAIAAPGHTPGHMALNISSGAEQLLCISDVVLHPIHLEMPEWHAAVDVAADQVISTRNKILKRAAGEKNLVMAFHFPFPGLGHIVHKGKAWQWQSVAKIR